MNVSSSFIISKRYIAENKELRNHIFTNQFVSIFRKLLTKYSDEIKIEDSVGIQFRSARVLVYMISEGSEKWTISCNSHEFNEVVAEIEKAISKWKIDSNLNLYSFETIKPIIFLFDKNFNPVCHRWACWVLANLITIKRNYRYKFLLSVNLVLNFLSKCSNS